MGYVLYPDFVFPNNAQVLTGSHIAQGEHSFANRDKAHIRSSLNVVKTSLGHFKDHAKSVSETPVAETKAPAPPQPAPVAPISEPEPSPPPEEAQTKAPAPSQPASYSTIEQTPEPKLTKSEGPPKLPAGAKLGT